MSTETVKKAGDVVFTTCVILKQDGQSLNVINQVEGITFYEDMYSPFITGEITLKDTYDIPNILGRLGKDFLLVDVHTPSIERRHHINKPFVIYKLGERKELKDRMQSFTLYFASIEYFEDINLQISRKFDGQADTVIEKIVKEYLKSEKDISVDPAANRVSFISNFWMPSKITSFVSEHAKGKNGYSDYLFYENRYGFNFKQLSYFSDKEVLPIQKFNGSNFTVDVNDEGAMVGKVVRDPIQDYSTLNGIRFYTSYNFLDDHLGGGIKTKLYTNDVLTKTIKWQDYNSFEDKNKKLLNKYNLYDDKTVGSLNYRVLHKNRGYGTFGLSEYSNYSTLQKRISSLTMINSSKVEIDVFGRTDYTVGSKVSLNVNQFRNIAKNELNSEYMDKIISGDYIITAIAHKVSRVSHICTMELSKESTLL